MKQESFEQRLRRQMEGYEVAPPDDLWAQIEKAAGTPASRGEKRRAHIMPLWMKVAAAGVAVAVVCGTGYELLTSLQESAESMAIAEQEGVTETTPRQLITEDTSTPTTSAQSPTSTTNDLLAAAARPTTYYASPKNGKAAEPHDVGATAETDNVPEVEDIVAYQAAEMQEETAALKTEKRVEADAQVLKEQQVASVARKSSERSRHAAEGGAAMSWNGSQDVAPIAHSRRRNTANVALYASNGLNGQQDRVGRVAMSPDMIMAYHSYNNSYNDAKSSGPFFLNDYEERSEHHQPVKYGVSIGIPLHDRWGLKTGVNYQHVKTDFTQVMSRETVTTEKTYDYVGVPLLVSYDLWRNNLMTVYGMAGTEMDVNVKARQRMEGMESSLKKDRLLFAVQGGAGVQVNCLPWLAVYAEPGVAYYIDNGSSADNVFKSKPLNINLQTGVRITLP